MADLRQDPLTRAFTYPGGQEAVLLIHGFTATPAQLVPLGKALQGAGYTVHAPLLPGHGTCIEDMHRYGGRAVWLDTVLKAYDMLAKNHRRVSVMGLSMGGVLSLLTAQQREPACCVAIAAPMRLINRAARFSPLMGPFVKVLKNKPRDEGPDFLMAYHGGYRDTPVTRVPDLLWLMGQAERNLAKVHCPLLVIQSRRDETVRPESVDIIIRGASSTVKETLWFEKSGHVCTIGPDREALFEACLAFLGRATAL